ncbi:10740_t:CDS:2 [Entrophospora sp. SA101]|nr:10740_t:CDS:2 [Entrophospora sp. SA101]
MVDVPENNRHYLDIPLTGELDLSSLVNLKQLNIHNQKITRLSLSGCSNLIDIAVDDNELEIIDFPVDGQQLSDIRLTNNNILSRDLICFTNFRNLKFLYLGTDQDGLRQDINATDVDSGLEYLPTEKLS